MILTALAISLIILFLHFCSWDGEIFEGIKKIIKPEGKIYKPIYGCPVCMTPYWGSAIYWIFYHISWIDWILSIGIAGGFAVIYVIFIGIKDSLEEIKNKPKNAINNTNTEDKQ